MGVSGWSVQPKGACAYGTDTRVMHHVRTTTTTPTPPLLLPTPPHPTHPSIHPFIHPPTPPFPLLPPPHTTTQPTTTTTTSVPFWLKPFLAQVATSVQVCSDTVNCSVTEGLCVLLEMSDGNGLGDGWPPSACRPVCLFSRTFLVLASFVGSFGCVLSLQRLVLGRNASPSLQFGFFDHDSEISINFLWVWSWSPRCSPRASLRCLGAFGVA